MRAALGVAVICVAGLMLGAGAATAGAPAINVSPAGAYRGESVRVFGSVGGGCGAGSQVTLISPAFSGAQQFAGVPAIFAPVQADGSFSKRTRIPRQRAPGRYTISGRCGGANLGVTASLRIRRARRCGNYTYDGPGEADEVSFIAIRTKRAKCRNTKRLLRRVAAAGEACPSGWTCVYPATGRAKWTKGRKRISFSPAG